MSNDPHMIGEPHPSDPFELSLRDVAKARLTGVHRHFSPANGEVYEFSKHPEHGWSAAMPGDEYGSTFGTKSGPLHDALREILSADISDEGAASGQREYHDKWNEHRQDFLNRTGHLLTGQEDHYADVQTKRWADGHDGPPQHTLN